MPVLKTTTDQDDSAKRQAIAQFHSIVEMVSAVRKAERDDNEDALEQARRAIDEDALSVEVRSDWHTPGSEAESSEYLILLCTGGPAVRIVGDLDRYRQPESARIQYQDWFRPWMDWTPGNSQNVESILLAYATQFYFGE